MYLSKKILSCLFVLVMPFTACQHSVSLSTNVSVNFDYLKGTWLQKESEILTFVDFYSPHEARFVHAANMEVVYDTFYYAIEGNQMSIKWKQSEAQETLHQLTKVDERTFKLSNFTVIPENPDIFYLKKEIVTDTFNDTIEIATDKIYCDKVNGFCLQMLSVPADSRCPEGAECVWAGDAHVVFDMVFDNKGGRQHFTLHTNAAFATDTLINNIRLTLIELLPYPVLNQTIKPKDYIVKVVVEKIE
ncbi:hypothetical protein [Saccharicrinis carchari]|nr:hypothetical protein [Saccharicrinis carchari]